jgi:hypothetical protein
MPQAMAEQNPAYKKYVMDKMNAVEPIPYTKQNPDDPWALHAVKDTADWLTAIPNAFGKYAAGAGAYLKAGVEHPEAVTPVSELGDIMKNKSYQAWERSPEWMKNLTRFGGDPINVIGGPVLKPFGLSREAMKAAEYSKPLKGIAKAASLGLRENPTGILARVTNLLRLEPKSKAIINTVNAIDFAGAGVALTDNTIDMMKWLDPLLEGGKSLVEKGGAFMSKAGQRTSYLLSGAAPEVRGLVSGFNESRTLWGDFARIVGVADEAGVTDFLAKTDLKTLAPEAKKLLDTASKFPRTLAELKGQIQFKLVDTSIANAVKAFGVKETSQIQRIHQVLKGAQSVPFLGWNPMFFMNNWINNMATTMVYGVPAFMSRMVEPTFNRLGIAPIRMYAGVGPAELALSGAAKVGQEVYGAVERGMRVATEPEATGLMAKVKRGLNQFQKTAVFAKASSLAESNASKGATMMGTVRYWMKSWRPGVGFTDMDVGLKAALSTIGVNPNDVLRAVRSSMNKEEMLTRVFSNKNSLDEIFHGLMESKTLNSVDEHFYQSVIAPALQPLKDLDPVAQRKGLLKLANDFLDEHSALYTKVLENDATELAQRMATGGEWAAPYVLGVNDGYINYAFAKRDQLLAMQHATGQPYSSISSEITRHFKEAMGRSLQNNKLLEKYGIKIEGFEDLIKQNEKIRVFTEKEMGKIFKLPEEARTAALQEFNGKVSPLWDGYRTAYASYNDKAWRTVLDHASKNNPSAKTLIDDFMGMRKTWHDKDAEILSEGHKAINVMAFGDKREAALRSLDKVRQDHQALYHAASKSKMQEIAALVPAEIKAAIPTIPKTPEEIAKIGTELARVTGAKDGGISILRKITKKSKIDFSDPDVYAAAERVIADKTARAARVSAKPSTIVADMERDVVENYRKVLTGVTGKTVPELPKNMSPELANQLVNDYIKQIGAIDPDKLIEAHNLAGVDTSNVQAIKDAILGNANAGLLPAAQRDVRQGRGVMNSKEFQKFFTPEGDLRKKYRDVRKVVEDMAAQPEEYPFMQMATGWLADANLVDALEKAGKDYVGLRKLNKVNPNIIPELTPISLRKDASAISSLIQPEEVAPAVAQAATPIAQVVTGAVKPVAQAAAPVVTDLSGAFPDVLDINSNAVSSIQKVLAALADGLQFDIGKPGNFTQLGAAEQKATRDMLTAWLKKVASEQDETKLAATKVGEWYRDQAMLNYDNRYGLNTVLGYFMPYEFWFTSSLRNWGRKFLETPALATQYARMRNDLYKTESDASFPARLKGMIKLEMPFLPDWMGDVFVDPLTTSGLPLENFLYGINNLFYQTTQQSLQSKLDNATKNGGTPEQIAEIRTALKEASGRDMMDYMGVLTSVPLWVQLVSNLVQGKPQPPIIPGAGFLRNVSALVTGKQGVDVSGALRGVANRTLGTNLPLGGEFDTYLTERMVSNMVGDGTITAAIGSKALLEHAGPAWDLAVARSRAESGVGMLLPGRQKIYPTGEENQRKLMVEIGKLYEAGDKTAISNWWKMHEDYVKNQIGKLPGERYSAYLTSALYDLPTLDRKQIATAYPDEMKAFYAGTATTEQLAKLADAIGVELPTLATGEPGGPPMPPAFKEGVPTFRPGKTQLEQVTPEIAKKYADFMTSVPVKFGKNIYDEQTRYYDLKDAGKPVTASKNLKSYWDYLHAFQAANPEISKLGWGKDPAATVALTKAAAPYVSHGRSYSQGWQ